jgi:hypothetical protein
MGRNPKIIANEKNSLPVSKESSLGANVSTPPRMSESRASEVRMPQPIRWNQSKQSPTEQGYIFRAKSSVLNQTISSRGRTELACRMNAFLSACPFRLALLLGCVFLGCIVPSETGAADEFVWSGPGCLLLKNGNVIRGKDISPRNKSVIVRIDETAEIQFPFSQVVHIGDDAKALYQFQVANTLKWEVGDHFLLAKWCLKNGLVEEAYGHYVQVKVLSGNHSKFKQFEAEIREHLLQDPVMQAAMKAAYPEAYATAQTSGQDGKEELSAPAPNTTPRTLIAISPIHQDYFRRQIQPFMVLRCGQAGCHGPLGKTDFNIGKSGSLKGRPASEISLESALKYLDQPQTEATQLWVKSTTRHGMQPTAALSVGDKAERELLERLRYWHQSIISAPKVSAPRETVATNAPVPNQIGMHPGPMPTSPSDAKSKNGSSVPLESDVGSELLMLEGEIAKLEEKEKARKQPTNRHDPEEYNRRYLNPLR